MLTSEIYRTKARILRKAGEVCAYVDLREEYIHLSLVWDRMADAAEEREILECKGSESQSTGKKYSI